MNYEVILMKKYEQAKPNDMNERIQHSINVVRMAKYLNRLHHFQISEQSIEQAGYLHDYAKYCSKQEWIEVINRHQLNQSILNLPESTWHATLAPHLIRDELGDFSTEVLHAISCHTTGRANMNLLEELIFVSDYIEEGRTYSPCQIAREMAKIDFKKTVAFILQHKLLEVKRVNGEIHPDTEAAYSFYKSHLHPSKNKIKDLLHLINHNLVTNIRIYDTTEVSALFDAVLVSTASSFKQMEAVIQYVESKYPARGVERGQFWVLIDLSDVIIHVFSSDARKEYGLDNLFEEVPLLNW